MDYDNFDGYNSGDILLQIENSNFRTVYLDTHICVNKIEGISS